MVLPISATSHTIKNNINHRINERKSRQDWIFIMITNTKVLQRKKEKIGASVLP